MTDRGRAWLGRLGVAFIAGLLTAYISFVAGIVVHALFDGAARELQTTATAGPVALSALTGAFFAAKLAPGERNARLLAATVFLLSAVVGFVALAATSEALS